LLIHWNLELVLSLKFAISGSSGNVETIT